MNISQKWSCVLLMSDGPWCSFGSAFELTLGTNFKLIFLIVELWTLTSTEACETCRVCWCFVTSWFYCWQVFGVIPVGISQLFVGCGSPCSSSVPRNNFQTNPRHCIASHLFFNFFTSELNLLLRSSCLLYVTRLLLFKEQLLPFHRYFQYKKCSKRRCSRRPSVQHDTKVWPRLGFVYSARMADVRNKGRGSSRAGLLI